MQEWDVLVAGAGHNGLVAACYLAKAGLRIGVLERREVPGGAAVTGELLPGYRVSTAAYSLSLLRPDIFRELDLGRAGLRFTPKDPQMFVPLPDGRHFFVWRDEARTREELDRIFKGEGEAYRRWGAFWKAAVPVLRPMVEDPDPPALPQLRAHLERHGQEEIWRLAVAGSVAGTVSEFFSSEEARGAFGSQGIIGALAGPYDPGTAWVMAYHALGGELNGMDGTWAWVSGGMGSVTQALVSAASGLGVTLRTSCPVDALIVDRGRVAGVVAGGGEIRCPVVVSCADPATTFLGLVPAGALPVHFEEKVRGWRRDGAVVKVNLALSEPPDFAALPGWGPQQRGTIEISPSIAYLEEAYQDARRGGFSSRPFMEAYLQSGTDPDLAPEGGHVLSVFAQYAGAPDAARQALQSVVDTLAIYAPNLPGAVVAAEALGPAELEERFGLPGGDIFHGSMLPEQCFGERFDYRTPLPGLYLCGSGARPGGGVMGAAGRNAARAVLADLK